MVTPDILQPVVDLACCKYFHCMADNVHQAVAVAVAAAVVFGSVVEVVAVVGSGQHRDSHLLLVVFLPLYLPWEQLLFQTAPTTSSCHDDKHKQWLAMDAQLIFHRLELCASAHSPALDNLPGSFVP